MSIKSGSFKLEGHKPAGDYEYHPLIHEGDLTFYWHLIEYDEITCESLIEYSLDVIIPSYTSLPQYTLKSTVCQATGYRGGSITGTAAHTVEGILYAGAHSFSLGGTFRIPYNSNGVCFNVVFEVYNADETLDSTFYNEEQNTTIETIPAFVLPDDLRSTIHCSAAKIGEKPIITIAKQTSLAVCTLKYTFGYKSGTIVSNFSGTSYNGWTVPDEFYQQMTNLKTRACTLTCITYVNGEEIGETSIDFNVNIDESVCKPVLAPTVVDTNATVIAVTGDENILVNGYSNAKCSSNTEFYRGAYSSSIEIKSGSKEATYDNSTINKVDSGKFIFNVKDSRGVSASATIEKEFIPYHSTTSIIDYTAPSVQGTTTVTMFGKFYSGNIGKTTNALDFKYRLRVNNKDTEEQEWTSATPTVSNDGYSFSLEVSNLPYMQTYIIETQVSDVLSSATAKVSLITKPIYDWSKEDFNFNVPVNINGSITADGANIQGDATFNNDITVTNTVNAKNVSAQTVNAVTSIITDMLTANTISVENFMAGDVVTDLTTLAKIEYGTWTPSLSAGFDTYSNGYQWGIYVKLGDYILLAWSMLGFPGSNSLSGELAITGIPFNAPWNVSAGHGSLSNAIVPDGYIFGGYYVGGDRIYPRAARDHNGEWDDTATITCNSAYQIHSSGIVMYQRVTY